MANIYSLDSLISELRRINPGVHIEKDNTKYNLILSNIDIAELNLPQGFSYNPRIGLTNGKNLNFLFRTEKNKMAQKEMSFEEKYQKLVETRQEQLSNNGASGNTSRAQTINRYFNEELGINTDSISSRIQIPYHLYVAPLKEITGSAMTTWGQNLDEIYVDSNFWKAENAQTIKLQLTHEMLHAISHNKDRKFAKPYGRTEYTGINEAATQVFADDINGTILSEDKDYLYFIKGIMRVMGNIVGKDKLALQYLNIDNSFEQSFNMLTNNQFESFAAKINEVYKLSKTQRYDKNNFSKENEIQLEELKKQLLDFTVEYLQKKMKENPDFTDTLISDFNDDNFLEKYDLLRQSEKDEISFNQVNRHERISDVSNRAVTANQMGSTVRTNDNTQNRISTVNQMGSAVKTNDNTQSRIATAKQMGSTIGKSSDANNRAGSANMMLTGQTISKQSINRIIAQNNITMTEVSQTTDTMLRQQRYKELNHKKTIGTLTPEEEEELKKVQPSVKRQQMQTMKRGH